MSQTLITSRDPKGLQAVTLFEAAYNKSKLNDEQAQWLNERGGEFKEGIMKIIAELSISDRYADEEVSSSYAYPLEYKGPRPIKEQINALAEIFGCEPTKALEYSNNLPPLPEGAEGWFAIPCIDAVAAKHFSSVTDPAEKYCQAVKFALGKIAESRPFYNCREGEITKEKLRVNSRTADALQKLVETQEGDILIIAAQLGMRHRGRSVRRACELFIPNEFGLGSLAVCSIALTHPERFARYEELDVDCAGDEFDFGDGRFFGAPCVCHGGGGVYFGASGVGGAGSYYGAASAFLPQ